MNLELTPKQFRRLLDLVYVGNWVLNSTRGEDRIPDYDEVGGRVFSCCPQLDMPALCEVSGGEVIPSRAFSEGGIHEAIMDYEDSAFFEILAEDLARRDMLESSSDPEDMEELNERMNTYIAEFELNGTDNVSVNIDK